MTYQTQVDIPVTTADFYFQTQPRTLIVFVDGRVHLGKAQMFKDEEYEHCYEQRDTESSNCSTEATRTMIETGSALNATNASQVGAKRDKSECPVRAMRIRVDKVSRPEPPVIWAMSPAMA